MVFPYICNAQQMAEEKKKLGDKLIEVKIGAVGDTSKGPLWSGGFDNCAAMVMVNKETNKGVLAHLTEYQCVTNCYRRIGVDGAKTYPDIDPDLRPFQKVAEDARQAGAEMEIWVFGGSQAGGDLVTKPSFVDDANWHNETGSSKGVLEVLLNPSEPQTPLMIVTQS
eukprot:TRINITY_DN95420_c0_g1_i1.p1 TRINITY_DN95420_c0_g1~~TRINITY_DN95420_c0_g1_i1.p1  ORF type:complete len:167 (-),score=28.36 TRINITY_DN95420_c0_g1_i1:76-576(-)